MKNIILVCPYFPPTKTIAASRMEAFAKYLSMYFNVLVVTHGEKDSESTLSLDNGTECRVVYLQNKSVFERFLSNDAQNKGVKHHVNTMCRKAYSWIGIGHYRDWKKRALTFLRDYLNRNPVDFVLTSYGPEESLDIGYELKCFKGMSEFRWILDMRDHYSGAPNISMRERARRKSKELLYFRKADLITSVSKPLLDLFEIRMPDSSAFLEIRNGFDHNIGVCDYVKGDSLKIGYFGTFYKKIKPGRFFDALISLDKNDIKFYCATKVVNFSVPRQLRERVHFLPYVDYLSSIKCMQTMDINLLVLPRQKGGGVYSGKLFDYISSGRPVLALVDPGDVAADLIRAMGCGYVADIDDSGDIERVLKQVWVDWKNESLRVPNQSEIMKLHRRIQINKLVEWLGK